ncbi:MAG: DUF3231 family protein [Dehalobacterium sp.]
MLGLFVKNQKLEIDCQEAYNLWDALKSRYDAIQLIQIYQNFIHDVEFKLLTAQTIMELTKQQTTRLEKQMNTYQLLLLDRPPKTVMTPANTEAFEDKYIASRLLSLIQENIGQLLRFIRTSLTNDDIRKMFVKFLKEEIDLYNTGVKFVKLKGWIGNPPMYKQVPEGNTEFLDAGEAFHLFDHLTSRYDNIDKTQLYQNFAHDIDLKVILLIGLQRTLEKQVIMLEKELNKFGIALPSQPPKSVNTTEGKDMYEDRKMFRDVFTGMQYMIELHATALRQSTTNDRLRGIYIKLLNDELSALDTWIKYGKIKGWLRPVPMYKI